MTPQTIAIVIGISEYKQTEIPSLPAAQTDALNFARALKNWGIPESNIFLFLNSKAQKQHLEDLFLKLSVSRDEFNLVFYFCGHGHRTVENVPKSHLIFHDSCIKEEKCTNSLILDNLFNKINKLPSIENYVIIDACSLRINKITHPKLEQEIKGDKKSRKSLFCLLSSGIEESFEGEDFGYFTESLLKGLSVLRVSGSPTELFNFIQKEMNEKELPLPEMYTIGHPTISFIQKSIPLQWRNGVVYRHHFILQIQSALIQNQNRFVCLIGDTGIGKTTLCHLLASEKLKVTYFSFLTDRFTDFEERTSSFVILDDVDVLNRRQLNSLLKGLVGKKTKFLLSSKHSLKTLIDEKFYGSLIDLAIPILSREEGKELIRSTQTAYSEMECEWHYLISRGNPLRILSAQLATEFEEQLKKTIGALVSCGMYINKHLFLNVFNLEESVLNFLEEVGLVHLSEQGGIPDDLLNEIVEEQQLTLNQSSTLNYWYSQIEEAPSSVDSAKHLLFSLRCFGYEEKADFYLGLAFRILSQKGKEHLIDLIESSDLFLSLPFMTEASLILAESLVEKKQFDLARLLLIKRAPTQELALGSTLCEIQRLWKIGSIDESISLCLELLALATDPFDLIKGHFYRGMAYFLNGNWNKSFSDFSLVCQKGQEPQYVGRAKCMLGTILGIRGDGVEVVQEYLLNGTRLLSELKDFAGVWAGWNNLGEIFWKWGDYKSSILYLEKALEMAEYLKSDEAKLETLRNLLHLHLRWNGPFSSLVTELLVKIEDLGWKESDFFVKMQTLNALSTAYLFRGEIQQPFALLKQAVALTSKNKEYHIYTLCNLSLLAKHLGLEQKSEAFFERGIELAKQGENHLGLHQIQTDFEIMQQLSDDRKSCLHSLGNLSVIS